MRNKSVGTNLQVFGDGYESRPSLFEGSWRQVDLLFEEVAAKLEPQLFVVLTESSAEKVATGIYAYFEPFDSMVHQGVVIAFDYSLKKVSVVADNDLWSSLPIAFGDLMNEAGRRLEESHLIDSLVFSLYRVREILCPEIGSDSTE